MLALRGFTVAKAYLLCAGAIEVVLQDGSSKKIGITRAHVEEDAGELQPSPRLTPALLSASPTHALGRFGSSDHLMLSGCSAAQLWPGVQAQPYDSDAAARQRNGVQLGSVVGPHA